MTAVVACFALLALTGCMTAPSASAPAGQGATGVATPAPAPAPPSPPSEPAPPAPRPLAPEELRPAIDSVRNQLDQGHEDTALEVVQRILATDANHKVANSYQRQIKDDPVTLYGAEHTMYRVAVGDTLASIAQRAPALKDRDQFYGLARYNDMKVPRQLQAGQMLKIPGKVPMPGTGMAATGTPAREAAAPAPSASATAASPVAAPTPAPATAATQAVAPATATVVGASSQGFAAHPSVPKPPPATGPSAADKQRLDQCMREARRAQERQETCIAIERWECVLRIDPTNRVAEVERERALQVKRRLPNPNC
jgi:hypothetical protein